MARYIDADKIPYVISIDGSFKQFAYYSDIVEIPTADVEEVVHARWEINCDGYYPYCSNCKTEPENGVMSKRCPECGAKMDGERGVKQND